MLQKLRSNRSVLSVGPMGTWTWTGPIGPRDQDGPDQSVLEIKMDRVEPIESVRLDSVQNRSVSVGLGRSRSVSVRSRPRLSIPALNPSAVEIAALISRFPWINASSSVPLGSCNRY